jgi:CDP-paratose 2-epimerase
MIILVTGGAGFVGSHAATYYAQKGNQVVCYDNLSRAELLKKPINKTYNWNYLKNLANLRLIKGDIRNLGKLKEAAMDTDVIIHTAAQTAVTTSMQDPRVDFEVNALGTFNVLEAARLSNSDPAIIYCSTNKVYGNNVNRIRVIEKGTLYEFDEDEFRSGISEAFPIDLCEHTPYGCSKLAADIYVQDYARLYGLKTAVFRMSCVYGVRQFGVEDQGWVIWFTIATILGRPITIYGNGKQVRDVLYVSDLVNAFDAFLKRKEQVHHDVFNMGGGPTNTLSLLELLGILEELTGKRSRITFSNWRPSDQKVYVSDVSKAKKILDWQPTVKPREGVGKLVKWVQENKEIFNRKDMDNA